MGRRADRAPRGSFGRTVGGLAAACLLFVCACGPSPQNAAAIEQAADRLAEAGGSLGALRRDFPDAYAAFKAKAKQKQAASDEALKALAFAHARDIALDRLDDFRAAPAPILRDHARSQAALVRQLQDRDVETCAALVMTGLPGKASFPPEAAELADETARLQLEAIAQGAARPASPPPFSDAAWRAWLDAMARRGVTWAQLEALSSSPSNRASSAERCRVGAAVYGTVPELPYQLTDEAARKLIVWSREGMPKAG